MLGMGHFSDLTGNSWCMSVYQGVQGMQGHRCVRECRSMGKDKGRGAGVCRYVRECRVQEWEEGCKDIALGCFQCAFQNLL